MSSGVLAVSTCSLRSAPGAPHRHASGTNSSRASATGSVRKALAAPSANITDKCACPCTNSITVARLVGPASIAPDTLLAPLVKERNISRFRLTHRPVAGPGRIFSTDVRDCSPARYVIVRTSRSSGGAGLRTMMVTSVPAAGVRFRQDLVCGQWHDRSQPEEGHVSMVEGQPEPVDLSRMLDLQTPWCLHVAATLRIPEHIQAGHDDIADLAAAAGCDRDALHA